MTGFLPLSNPREPIPFEIERLTGINDGMVMDEPPVEEVLPGFWTSAVLQSWWPTMRPLI